jgi:hypothetical protein
MFRSMLRASAGLVAVLLFVGGAVVYTSLQQRPAGAVRGAEPSSNRRDSSPSALPKRTDKREVEAVIDGALSLTPTGICEAVRAGDLDLLKRILAEKPELLTATNPANWANLKEMRVHPWASRPVEIAAIFGHADALAYLLSRARPRGIPSGDTTKPSRSLSRWRMKRSSRRSPMTWSGA